MKKYVTVLLLLTCILLFGRESRSGRAIPDLKIKLINGKQTSIHDLLKDGPLLIDFWATWCKPCKKVMKHLDRYHQAYGNHGFKVLMINQDTPRSLGKVKSYIRSKKHTFYVGLDPNQETAKKLNGQIMPTLILVDRDGTIQWRHQGYIPGEEEEIERQIRIALGLVMQSDSPDS
ncbi:MAG: TlpA disulfide reductase family protein [Candidatus Neomarinimicrobiota bacterium]|nr:TlpA disulfide reductase family protein [Candidatus Neomarinimicrobiota bacterium]